MKKLNYRQKIYLLLGFFLAAIFTVSLLLVWPTLNRIEISSKDLNIAKRALDQTYQKWFGLEKSKRIINDIEPKKIAIETFVLEERNALILVQKIEAIAEETQTQHTLTLVPSPPAAKKSETLPLYFQLQVYGEFFPILEFLKKLENVNYALNLESFSLVKPDSAAGAQKGVIFQPGQLKASINFSVPVIR